MHIRFRKRDTIGHSRWADRIARTTREVMTGLRQVGHDEADIGARTIALAKESIWTAGEEYEAPDSMLFRHRDGSWELEETADPKDPFRPGKYAVGLFRRAHALQMELQPDDLAAETFMAIVQRTIEADLAS